MKGRLRGRLPWALAGFVLVAAVVYRLLTRRPREGGALPAEDASPLRAVAAGQTVVLYDGDTAVVSGTINSTRRLDAPVER